METSTSLGPLSERPFLHETILCCGNCVDGCINYEAPGKRFAKCSGCKFRVYCSRQCQQADWPQHRRQCKRLSGALGGGVTLRSRLTAAAESHAARSVGVFADLVFASAQCGTFEACGDSSDQDRGKHWASPSNFEDSGLPRRPTLEGCEQGPYLPLFYVASALGPPVSSAVLNQAACIPRQPPLLPQSPVRHSQCRIAIKPREPAARWQRWTSRTLSEGGHLQCLASRMDWLFLMTEVSTQPCATTPGPASERCACASVELVDE